ncbi:hypothetical protein EON65_06580 [archaeon]|nr:MAG: hypothetical protein EON65_06580 [archaeon]
MSPQDLSLRLQNLRAQNAMLESERNYFKTLYETTLIQKEEVRSKAKEAVRVMKAMYNDYEELQEIVKSKDNTIQSLKATIKNLEYKLISQSERARTLVQESQDFADKVHVDDGEYRLENSMSSKPDLDSTSAFRSENEPVSSGAFDPEESFLFEPKKKATVESTPPRHRELTDFPSYLGSDQADPSEECAVLRARVAELEGLLLGTLYHSATKATPHKISEKDIAPFSPPRKADAGVAVSKMIEALQQAASASQPGTPMVRGHEGHVGAASEDTMEASYRRGMHTPKF